MSETMTQYRATITATDGRSWTTGWMWGHGGVVPRTLLGYARNVEELHVAAIFDSPKRGRTIEIYRRELVPSEPEVVASKDWK